MAACVAYLHVHHHGIAGRFFAPADPPGGAVIVLGGSGGGIEWASEMAAQLAAEGYAALALAYFRWPGLARHLAGIRLEYVADAIRWMQVEVAGAARPVALVGASRGAELALLAGPVLLVSGAGDSMWPSAAMGESIRLHLEAAGHPFEVRHLIYDGAGHAASILRTDAYPTTAQHSITRMVYDLGGSESANKKASESARTEALRFLSRHVEQRASDDRSRGC